MSRDPRLTIARRELRSLSTEKTIVLALAIQLFVAGFSSFLVVGLVSMYDPGSVEAGQASVGVAGEAGDDLVAALSEADTVEVSRYDDAEAARADFQRARLDAVLIATKAESGQLQVRATVPDEGIGSTLVVVQLREALQVAERVERSNRAHRLSFDPLPVPEGGDASPYFGFTYTVLVPLLLFLPVFISGSIAVDSISEELDRGTLELLRVAPVSLVGILDGKLLAAAGIAPLQAAAWLALLSFNGIGISNAVALLSLVAAMAVGLVALGLGIALVAPDRRQGQLVYSVGVLAAFVAAGTLPEHPANTVARLAIDSATPTTWLLVGCYVVAGIGALVAIRRTVRGLSPSQLGGDR